ncbi:enoyl-CoA hydratase [Rhodococcus erythropolis]|nr:enoyl-CoA hydratase [Rhodococcus qingshengii BKS 20-40]OQM77891.1 putative enoyl-CoA hydratase 1 [Rhodococcus sp. 66b]ORI22761.1 enoyl-CoA hydratase [Rhodococcus erythropolis]
MIEVDSARDLSDRVGTLLGRSEWVNLPADTIKVFGAITRDEHWIHVDRARAAEEGPFGDVIAHGFFLLSLVTGLGNQCYVVRNAQRWTNYGLDRVRFTAPVTPDDSVRLAMKLESLDETASGYRLVLECELELKDSPRPALVARWIVLVTEKEV